MITVRRSLDDANAQARADTEEAEHLPGQLRSAAEARDAAVWERGATKDDREAAIWECDEAVLSSTLPPSPLKTRGEKNKGAC